MLPTKAKILAWHENMKEDIYSNHLHANTSRFLNAFDLASILYTKKTQLINAVFQ